MRKLLYVLVMIAMAGCNSDTGIDCLQTAGDKVVYEVDVTNFSRVLVNQNSQLFIEQGDNYNVLVETGENLTSDIKINVIDDQLIITNKNNCNFVRDFDETKVVVTAPNLTEIRNSSNFTVTSIGVLSFPQLQLLADDSSDEVDFYTDGNWDLQLNTAQLSIITNGFGQFKLSGRATNAFYGIYAGHSFIDASNLVTQNVSFFHRGSNQLIVNPQESIEGTLYSIGDVISKNEPPIVNVEELFKGRLIFE